MASGKLGEKREIGRRLNSQRRDGHQPGERQRRTSHRGHDLLDLPDLAAAFLLLLPDIHLDIERGEAMRLLRLPDERVEQRAPVERMDRIEQLYRIAGLV